MTGVRRLPLIVVGKRIYFADQRLNQLRDTENARNWHQLSEERFDWLMRVGDFDAEPRVIDA